MLTPIKLLLFLLAINLLLGSFLHSQLPGTEEPNINAYNIVFVLDVSSNLDAQVRKDTIVAFIKKIYREFNGTEKNAFYLVPFSDKAKWYQLVSVQISSNDRNIKENDIKSTIDDQFREKNYYNHKFSDPKRGFGEVLSNLSQMVPDNIGIVLFISSGAYGKKGNGGVGEDIKKTVASLTGLGFSILTIHVPASKPESKYEENLKLIANLDKREIPPYKLYNSSKIDEIVSNIKAEIEKLDLSTPVSREKYTHKIESLTKENKKLKSELNKNGREYAQLEEKVSGLKDNLENKKNIVGKLTLDNEKLSKDKKNLLMKRKNQKFNSINLKDSELKNSELKTEITNLQKKAEKKNYWYIIIGAAVILILCIIFVGIRKEKEKRIQAEVKLKDIEEREQKRIIEEAEKKGPELDKLWGKLVYKDENYEDKEIPLNKEKDEYVFMLRTLLTNAEFKIIKQNSGKAIMVTPEKGKARFLNKNKVPCTNNYSYIEKDTSFIQFLGTPNGKPQCQEVEYIFLNKLRESCRIPVWKKEEFVGREDIIERIKENFLNPNGHHRHCIISGMGNSGKTSLMNHLAKVTFKDDDELAEKYVVRLFEFNIEEEKKKKFSYFKNFIFEEIDTIEENDYRIRVIMIDEYDNLFNRFPKPFIGFFSKCINKGHFLILSGQKGKDLLNKKIQKTISTSIFDIQLVGMDKTHLPNTQYRFDNSLTLINNLLSTICFPEHYFQQEAKEEIALMASGLPSLIKVLLQKSIENWLDRYDTHPIDKNNVRQAVFDIQASQEMRLFKRAYDYDSNNNFKPDGEKNVSMEEIVLKLIDYCDSEGKIPVKLLEEKVVKKYNDENLIKERSAYFKIKITQLISMGYIIEEQSHYIGVPLMLLQKKEKQC